MNCGLLGKTLGHSYSPRIHSFLGDYSYDLYEKEPEEVASFLKNGTFTGINVTIPYKKAVIPYLDELSSQARMLGAVNTIVRRPDGTLWGHNTDYFGFQSLMERTGLVGGGKKALVLGSGGASNVVCAVLRNMGAIVVIISRSGENNYGNLHLHQDAALIVNTTPVGMYPNCGVAPVVLSAFPALLGVVDVIYNPAKTQLLLDAEALGIPSYNGLWMLVAQAWEAARCFTGTEIPPSVMKPIYHTLSREMQNIILIGMPGCGKSTVGTLLAQKYGKRFVDADAVIEQLAGKPIPEIFAQDGEPAFRDWETLALKELGKQSGLVIATGGGCVTRERNLAALRQNGRVFWLKRDLHLLPTEGRPLSQSGELEQMYRKRKPMYEAFAQEVIHNSGSPEETADAIWKRWEETV